MHSCANRRPCRARASAPPQNAASGNEREGGLPSGRQPIVSQALAVFAAKADIKVGSQAIEFNQLDAPMAKSSGSGG